MFESFMYYLPLLALIAGLIILFVGKTKNNKKLVDAGIGLLVCLVVLESPDFIRGFIRGFSEG